MPDDDKMVLVNNSTWKLVNAPSVKICSYYYQYDIVLDKCIKQNSFMHKARSPKWKSFKNQDLIISIIAILAGISFGYDMTIGSQTINLVKERFHIDCHGEKILVNIWMVGCLVGAICGGILIDSCGRRWSMIFSSSFLIIGSLLSALSDNYIIFLLARIICGYSSTVSTMSHYIYMAEVSKTAKRGCNIMFYEIGSATGILFALVMFIQKHSILWKYYLVIPAIPTFFTLVIIIIFLPKSASFILLQKISNIPRLPIKNMYYILKVLIIMAITLILREFSGRMQVLYYAPRLFALLGICSNLAKSVAMISLSIVKIFSTILSLMIVEKCGRRSALITSATICMASVSFLSLLSSLDNGNELLHFPNELCFISKNPSNMKEFLNIMKQTSLSESSPPYPPLPTPVALNGPNSETWIQLKTSCETENIRSSELTGGLKILAVVTVLIFESAYALGLGPVPFLTLSEIFPAAIRGKYVAFSVVVTWSVQTYIYESMNWMTHKLKMISYLICSILLTIFFLGTMSLPGMYLLYSLMCLVTIIYVFFVYPETKGKSLNLIAQEIKKLSLTKRIDNNWQSLPLICHINWISKKSTQITLI